METENMTKPLSEMSGKEAIETIGREMYGKKFSLDEPETLKIYKEIHDQLTDSINKPEEVTKGIFINGSIGVGKTAMMRIFQRLVSETDRCFKMVTASHLKFLSEELTTLDIMDKYGAAWQHDLLIDDIGLSIDVKRFGNTVNIITDLIQERYDVFTRYGRRTHFTSNIVMALPDKPEFEGKPSIENIYGRRVYDRIFEMCETYTWVGQSKR